MSLAGVIPSALLVCAFTPPAFAAFAVFAVFDGSDFGPQQLLSSTALAATGVTAVDLDGDGDNDVLSASESAVAWFENLDGLGGFSSHTFIADGADIFGEVTVFAADLDGDGDVDVLSSSQDDDEINWFENLGGALFGAPQLIHKANGASFVTAADIDGDGDQDVLAAAAWDDEVTWHENDGSGGFGPPQTLSTTAPSVTSIGVGDLDGDGDLDALTAARLDQQVAWHANTDGLGTFGAEQVIGAFGYEPAPPRVADFDGDGDQDVLASWLTGWGGWFKNSDGAGAFATVTVGYDGYGSVREMDADGDGDLDVLVAASLHDEVLWFENLNGHGAYGPSQLISDLVDLPMGVAAADLDGDSLPEALSASEFDNRLAWYRNEHCSVATPAAEIVRLGTPPNPAALLPGVTAGPAICTTWDPVVDHSSFLPAAVADFLGVSPLSVNIPTSFGTLLCGLPTPALTFAVAAGAPFQIPIPEDCSLVGAVPCAQAVSVDASGAIGLTNALDLTIGSL